jgi:hypothetical protein
MMEASERLAYKTILWIVITLCSFINFTAGATDEVDMQLNDQGFDSFDHFKAQLRLNNQDEIIENAQIFGIKLVQNRFSWTAFCMMEGCLVTDKAS